MELSKIFTKVRWFLRITIFYLLHDDNIYVYIYIYIYMYIWDVSENWGFTSKIWRVAPKEASNVRQDGYIYIYIFIYLCIYMVYTVYMHIHIYIYIYLHGSVSNSDMNRIGYNILLVRNELPPNFRRVSECWERMTDKRHGMSSQHGFCPQLPLW